jgi:putative multiple sugar transport system substrate-binding protein
MRKNLSVLLILLTAASLVIGCRKADAGLIGIAMPEIFVLRWVKDGNSMKAEAERLGYRAEVEYGEANQVTQNTQIQNFLTQGARLLIVNSINEDVGSALAEAALANVPVIAYDRIIFNSADYDYFITFNDFKVGVLQAESIVAGLNLNAATSDDPKLIALFAGSPTDGNSFFLYDGAMSILNPFIDRGVLRVIGPYPRTSADRANFHRITTENGNASVARARMESLLNNDARNVTLDAVLAPDDAIARAIIEVLKTDGKYFDNLPVVTGQYAEFASMMMIKNGEQFSTVFKDTARLAEAAVMLADQILKGEPINIPGVILATGELAEMGNTGLKYVNAYLLEPVLITRDNLLLPVDAGFYASYEARDLRHGL